MSTEKTKRKNKVTLKSILRRPIVRLLILIILIIVIVSIVKNKPSKEEEDIGLVGYQKLVDITDNVYTFVDLDGNSKTYSGYSSMDDFYYDTTCVSKKSDDGTKIQMALINKSNKEVVKYDTYDSYSQVIGGKYYKVEKEGKYGIIRYNGDVLINPEYDSISITTIQDATELIFECQKDNTYYFITETGKTLMDTQSALHSISYSTKFNEDYHTAVIISTDGQKRYFDAVTGDEIFTDKQGQDITFSYNILKEDGKISFYDKNLKLKQEIDVSQDYSSNARVYFKKYVLVEQKNVESGDRTYSYTVYNSDFKEVLNSDKRINPVEDVDGNVYFIINETDHVRIVSENGKEIKIDGYEYNGSNTNELEFIVLNAIGDSSKNEIYTFKGKQVVADVDEVLKKGFGLIYTTTQDSTTRHLILRNNTLDLDANDEVTANDYYIIIENSQNNTISVVDKDGKVIVDKVTGARAFFTQNYIGVQNTDNVDIYNVKNGSKTFTYANSNYVSRDEAINVVELQDGYYTFNGKLILGK